MESLLDNVEQDNNPLLYAPYLPYGRPSVDLVSSLIGLLQRIADTLERGSVAVAVPSSERLAGLLVIVYAIEISSGADTFVVKRRYSEFKLLRDVLARLFPTVVVPPIPDKHSLLSYLLNSIDNSKETSVVEVRRRCFASFLNDLVFDANTHLRRCPLLHKFLDPNYELAWENALAEPPASLLPPNLLLANPTNPTDQNGLYMLLPPVPGFDMDRRDLLPPLRRLADDVARLNAEIELYSRKSREPGLKFHIPPLLYKFEADFAAAIRVLHDANKLNGRLVLHLKAVIALLVELGGTLNNFSLQIHEPSLDNALSAMVERFGSTMDLNFLLFELFVHTHLVPHWQEPVEQFLQYYQLALQLVKLYKYKLVQYRLVHRLKFAKIQEHSAFHGQLVQHLKDLNINSPSINQAILRAESKQRLGRKLWYGLFGGNKQVLPEPEAELLEARLQHVEKELGKLNQLVALTHGDLANLTLALETSFAAFVRRMERKWCEAMLAYVRAAKTMFAENEQVWRGFKMLLEESGARESGPGDSGLRDSGSDEPGSDEPGSDEGGIDESGLEGMGA